ncbi:D(2)-like dopamine receptor [Actinia tenebrosa]|uniref:D(2)-like dopamine receptor n=1 Tax=Actinia tenebrosa TaxID=6105 RepID=A0A6P8IAD3_ACTTE|nr:D(2)-like dopamine receptor [Actinia tenebrosa]
MSNIGYIMDNRSLRTSNNTRNSTSINRTSETIELSARVIVSIALMIIIILGNSLVILAYKKNHRLRTGTYTFLVSLAISDFLVGSVSLPLWIYGSVQGWPLPDKVYTFFICFDIFSALASTLHLSAVSLERFVAISKPFYYKTITFRSYFVWIGVAWGLAFVVAALHPRILSTVLPIPKDSIHFMYQVHGIVLFSCGYLAPMVLITTVNIRIFKIAKKLIRNMARPSQVTTNRNSSSILNYTRRRLPKERKTAITLVMITGLFFAAWLPFFIVNMLSLYCLTTCLSLDERKLLIIVEFTKWLHYSNSAINAVIYAFRDIEMRKTFISLLWPCCRPCKGSRVDPTSPGPSVLRTRHHSSSSVSKLPEFLAAKEKETDHDLAC